MSVSQEKRYQIIFAIVFILGVLSLIGSFTIIISYFILKYFNSKYVSMIKDYICVLSIFDFMFTFMVTLTASNPALNYNWHQNISNELCWFQGFIVQISTTGSSSISIVMVLGILWPLLADKPQSKQRYHIIIVSLIVTMSCCISITKYGFGIVGDSLNLYRIYCWISDPNYFLTLYLPMSIYITISWFMLIYYFYIRFSTNKRITSSINQLILYTIVFMIHWIPALIGRWFNIISKHAASIEIVTLMWIGFSIRGFGNVIIWFIYYKDYDISHKLSAKIAITSLKLPTYITDDKKPTTYNTNNDRKQTTDSITSFHQWTTHDNI